MTSNCLGWSTGVLGPRLKEVGSDCRKLGANCRALRQSRGDSEAPHTQTGRGDSRVQISPHRAAIDAAGPSTRPVAAPFLHQMWQPPCSYPWGAGDVMVAPGSNLANRCEVSSSPAPRARRMQPLHRMPDIENQCARISLGPAGKRVTNNGFDGGVPHRTRGTSGRFTHRFAQSVVNNQASCGAYCQPPRGN